jgi:hypothetical protein
MDSSLVELGASLRKSTTVSHSIQARVWPSSSTQAARKSARRSQVSWAMSSSTAASVA